jgi:hypothetical protein
MPASSISGKFLTGKVGIGDIDGIHEWSVNETADRLEATTGADGGRGKKDVGVIDTRIRVVFYLGINDGQYIFIRPGTTITNRTRRPRSTPSRPRRCSTRRCGARSATALLSKRT